MTNIVKLFEDNSGAIYLQRDGQTWGIGPVTFDMLGRFASDAAAWVAGEWEPSEEGGQVLAKDVGLDHIATWTSAGIRIETYPHGSDLIAGNDGESYIGHVLVDVEGVREFVSQIDDPLERVKYVNELIEQARQVEGWLASLRAVMVATAAEHIRQVDIAVGLGITESRVSQMVTEGRRIAESNVWPSQ